MQKPRRILSVALLATVGASLGVTWPATANPAAYAQLFATGLNQPLFLTHAPGDTQHVFVCERPGMIRAINVADGSVITTPMLDITAKVSLQGDGGFLGLAFDPAYTTNGYIYVLYIDATSLNEFIVRYHVPTGTLVADPTSAYTIWTFARPVGHYGGWLGFSPTNGYLYISSGDGDTGAFYDLLNAAQTTVNQPLGKIFRIDPHSDDFPNDPNRNYHIPPTNPFVGKTGDPEIWSYGVRNPFRCSFDRATGDFYFGDVGQDSWEEVNMEPASSPGGRNYGWRCMEGNTCTGAGGCTCGDPSLTPPIYTYPHTQGNSAIGGYVYRGAAIPALQGTYFYGDWGTSKVWSFTPSAGGISNLQDQTISLSPAGGPYPISQPAGLGEDAAGEIYICNLTGNILKIVPYPCTPDILVQPVTNQKVPVGRTITLTAFGIGSAPLTFQWQKGATLLVDDGRIQGSGTATLTIASATIADSGMYTVVLTSPCGNTPSSAAQVTVFVCAGADFNGDGKVTIQDIFSYLNAWFLKLPSADFDHSGTITIQDIFEFLTAWFAGCP